MQVVHWLYARLGLEACMLGGFAICTAWLVGNGYASMLCLAWRLGGLEAWLCFMHKWCIQACIKAFVLLVHIGVHKALFCLCKCIGYMHGLEAWLCL